MKHTASRHARIRASDLDDLVHGTSSTPLVCAAIEYRNAILGRLRDRLVAEPSAVRRMATDALECVMVGLRNEFNTRSAVQGHGLWADFSSRFGVVHPQFENDAFAIYIGVLADAAHNLPSIIKGTFEGSSADEIGNTLVWLYLMPSTRTAAEIAFDRLLSEPVERMEIARIAA